MQIIRSNASHVLKPVNLRSFGLNFFRFSSSDKKSGVSEGCEIVDGICLPPEPTNCCMSGCANCVWVKYAEELQALFKDGGVRAREIILSKIQDPNMKAFLELELRTLNSQKPERD